MQNLTTITLSTGLTYEVSHNGDDILLTGLTSDEERVLAGGFLALVNSLPAYDGRQYIGYRYRAEQAEELIADYAIEHFNEAKIFEY